MRPLGVGASAVLAAFGLAGASSSNDEARLAAYSAIAVAIVTATGTIIGQIVTTRANRKNDQAADDLRDIALLILLDSHTADPETKAEAEELAKHVRDHMNGQRRERFTTAKGNDPVAPPRTPRRRRRPQHRRTKGGGSVGPGDP